MKSFGLVLSLVSAVGAVAMAAPITFAQASGQGQNWLSASETVTYQPAQEAARVQETLSQFDSALAMHDVGGLQAAGIKRVNARRWQRFSKTIPAPR